MNNTVMLQEKKTPAGEERGVQRPEQRRGWLQPQVNIVEGNEGYVLEAEMPGVSKEGLEILLEGNELTIIGHRNNGLEGSQLVYRESTDRDFRRNFELDPAIDTVRISARMENGLLFLTLPKAEKVKPRKISVE
ncbi:MAG TPA: Hsp20/alpha crystallin family protein [Verrucomicrobiae bacterium]|jgi:HSP20 family protein|nr:Hsp20/alpha crystallin family protein [Verrucomicrobiae bacterium]